MTKNTKRYIGIFIILFAIACIIGIVTRFSYHGSITLKQLENRNDINEYSLQLDEDGESEDIFDSIHSYDELKKFSEVIAKIKVSEDRELYSDTIKTKVTVEDIYKNNNEIENVKEIYIYEPFSFNEDLKVFSSTGGYQLMKTGEEYYVFLNSLKTIDKYKKSKDEKLTFTPSTTQYSIIPIKERKVALLEQEKANSGEYCYQDIKDFDILTMNLEVFNTYKMITKDIKKNLSNTSTT